MRIRESKEDMLQGIEMFNEMLNGTSQRAIAKKFDTTLSKTVLRINVIRRGVYRKLPEDINDSVWRKENFLKHHFEIRKTLSKLREEVIRE